MKKSVIFWMLFFALFTRIYPEVLTTFPDMVKPIELRMNGGYIYISDQNSIFVYDKNAFKLVKRLGKKGEGPEEFSAHPKITFTSDRLILFDGYKIVMYLKNFKLVEEIKLRSFTDRANPIGNCFVLTNSKVVDEKEYRVFALYNSKMEKIRDLVTEPVDQNGFKFLLGPWSRCRNWENKIFIAQPYKGFYINVFNEQGKALYHIEKKVKKVKSEGKHRKLFMEEILYFLGRRHFERVRARGVYKKPMKEFLPPIKNFWVLDDRIYVKTYDITDKKEKYVIMDLDGNILRTLFLPIVHREILTFDKGKFYYLKEIDEDEVWALHSINL